MRVTATPMCIIGDIHVDFVIRVPRIPSIGETILDEIEVYSGDRILINALELLV